MKVAHIYYSLNIGGIETLLCNISNWQVKDGHQITIILTDEKSNPALLNVLDKRIKVVNLGRKPSTTSILSIVKLNLYLFLNKFDVVHVHAAELGNVMFSYSGNKVMHIHATQAITNKVIPKKFRYISISKAVANIVEQEFNTSSTVIYNGINFSEFQRRENNELSNKMICVGSLNNKVKNQERIIQEFASVKDKISSNLYLVGEGPDLDFFSRLIHELKLTNRAFILGLRDQDWLKQNLCNYDLFIQASLSEGLGISAIEAVAAGLPVLLSEVDGHIEITSNGTFGDLFNPDLDGDLARKLIDFYDSPQEKFELARESYVSQGRRFNFENYNLKLLEFYLKPNNLKEVID